MLSGGGGIDGLDRLDVRLVALLGLALLPIGLIAMVQTYRVISEADRTAEAALTGVTLSAATTERETLLRVRGAAQMAAEFAPTILNDPTLCSERMQNFVRSSRTIAFAGFVSADGFAICASDGAGTDVRDTDAYRAYLEDPVAQIEAVVGVISQRSVVVITEPVVVNEVPIGYIAMSVPQQNLRLPTAQSVGLDPLFTTTFTESGEILWADGDLEALELALPADRALTALAGEETVSFRSDAVSGDERFYTVAPLIQDEIYALAIWPANAIRTSGLTAASAILFPILMWLVSIGVAYFAVHRLVVRHIRYLRLRIRAFTANRRIMAPTYAADTPSDLREVIEAFHQMTERIVRDEADLENNLHEKDVLLKEVHHRVKNNLQLIASMMNMQLRKATHDETRFILRRLQDRVLGLATIHRNLYQASVLSRVNSSQLIEELVAQSLRNSDVVNQGVKLDISVDPVSLYPDQAVPLSLLVTETMTNAMKYVGRPPEDEPWIELKLAALPSGEVQLRVANSLGEPLSDESRITTGLGTQLMSAFAMQLDAQSEIGETDGAFVVDVTFMPSEFADEP